MGAEAGDRKQETKLIAISSQANYTCRKLLRYAELGDGGAGEAFNEDEDKPGAGEENEADNGPLEGLHGGGVGFRVGAGADQSDAGHDDHGQSGESNNGWKLF